MRFPNFYERQRVGTLYRPRIGEVIREASSLALKPSSGDERRVLLLLVDPQVDFVHADGSLNVPGAVDDARRTVEWLFNNLEQVTDIVVSLDSHYPLHIFYPGWWIDEAGKHPEALTPITAQEVDDGRWRPAFEEEWSRYYVHELEKKAKKTLLIWPYHTMIGAMGHSITPALYEAITLHSGARRSLPTYVVKGRIPKTEHYSIFEPEVKVPEDLEGSLNTGLLERMSTYDRIFIAGQAKSHCVLETVTSIANLAEAQPELITKLRLLADCMSSVVHPDIDFEAMANETLEGYSKLGLQLVSAADSIDLAAL
ncbi:MAG: cysteine hydrolase family protein [Chloroflexota bacterium]|nr:MAG: cysteine hydrolase family protein [Chloroflexota bacterium]